jgi:hypothetical protein
MGGLETDFVEISGRDASEVIRGFQINLTIPRWIELPPERRLPNSFD